jgi:hypothetical protein
VLLVCQTLLLLHGCALLLLLVCVCGSACAGLCCC